MSKLRSYLITAVGIVFIVSVLSITATGVVHSHTRGAARVRVVNTVDHPVLVRDVNDARQPFQRVVSIPNPAGSLFAAGNFTVPGGKRLVIEHVSILSAVPPGQKVLLIMNTQVEGQPADHFLLADFQGSFGGTDRFFVSQPIRVYADPGTSVVIRTERTSTGGNASYAATVSGFLVDVP